MPRVHLSRFLSIGGHIYKAARLYASGCFAVRKCVRLSECSYHLARRYAVLRRA